MSNTNHQELEQRVEAVKAALEWSKQILTLATGTLVLSGTFVKDVFKANGIKEGWIVELCWILMSASVFFGILFLGVMVNLLNEKTGADVNIYKHKGIGIAHVLTFFAGLICFVVFISLNLTNINLSVLPAK